MQIGVLYTLNRNFYLIVDKHPNKKNKLILQVFNDDLDNVTTSFCNPSELRRNGLKYNVSLDAVSFAVTDNVVDKVSYVIDLDKADPMQKELGQPLTIIYTSPNFNCAGEMQYLLRVYTDVDGSNITQDLHKSLKNKLYSRYCPNANAIGLYATPKTILDKANSLLAEYSTNIIIS